MLTPTDRVRLGKLQAQAMREISDATSTMRNLIEDGNGLDHADVKMQMDIIAEWRKVYDAASEQMRG